MAMTEHPKVLLIAGIPKSVSWKKLKQIIVRHTEDSSIIAQIYPQDSDNILEVSCSEKSYKRLLQCECSPLLMISGNVKIYPTSACITNSIDNSNGSLKTILDLNYDCLRNIFKYCSLKDQITVAKVCRNFCETIRDIWCGSGKKYLYNPYKMEFEQNLSNDNVKEMFSLFGLNVETLRYDTRLYFPLIQRYVADFSGNLVTFARKFININLCRHLMYFENVKIFEVEGTFITDFTIRELARYCDQIHTFRLLDTDVRFFKGSYLHLLSNLEVLHIRDCRNFTYNNLMRICRNCKIKNLDIVDCDLLQNPKCMQAICQVMPNLQILKISAQMDKAVLASLLELKKMEYLEFFWTGKDDMKFEVLLLETLTDLRAETLRSIKLVNNFIPIEIKSSQPQMDDIKYAELREKTAATGRAWVLNNEFDKIITFLSKQYSLEEITFEYCRPFSRDNLLQLQKQKPPNLALLKFIGSATKEDIKTKELWNEQMQSNKSQKHCELQYESVIPASQVEQFKQRLNTSVLSDSHYTPTMRSIQCCFEHCSPA